MDVYGVRIVVGMGVPETIRMVFICIDRCYKMSYIKFGFLRWSDKLGGRDSLINIESKTTHHRFYQKP
jgi:hypothetical protein